MAFFAVCSAISRVKPCAIIRFVAFFNNIPVAFPVNCEATVPIPVNNALSSNNPPTPAANRSPREGYNVPSPYRRYTCVKNLYNHNGAYLIVNP